ncbi:hypothetical protein BC827DRAFT_1248208 [Russula dissimulans]|nr:hypothetical protein BC827DRAFT_1248208 [Russula dissimulans]
MGAYHGNQFHFILMRCEHRRRVNIVGRRPSLASGKRNPVSESCHPAPLHVPVASFEWQACDRKTLLRVLEHVTSVMFEIVSN